MIGRTASRLSGAFVACAVLAGAGAAQDDAPALEAGPSRFLVVYDSSNSMWGELADSSRKYEAGREALSSLLEGGLAGMQVGLRAYGHRRPDDCSDTELVVPLQPFEEARAGVAGAAEGMRPTGRTPITRSLREGRNDLGPEGGDILLISDGVETCDIDPCALMAQWADADVNIRVHVVGVGLSDIERDSMACIADRSGGRYFDADSATQFAEAVVDARAAIETPRGEPDPRDEPVTYALLIEGRDATGRDWLTEGAIYRDGEPAGEVTSNGRNPLEGPGAYEIEVGARLTDGSLFQPVRLPVEISEPGETRISVEVAAPAQVRARFVENGEAVTGALITAYADGQEAFSFRPADEALARPGAYEFRSSPNQDNELSLTAELTGGELTEIVFDLVQTVPVLVELVLPDGQVIRRNSALWRDGEQLYTLNGANPEEVRPGIYELRSDDPDTPLSPVEVEVPADGGTVQVPLAAGFVTIAYAPSEQDYLQTPDRAFIESMERGGSRFARLDEAIALSPGEYRLIGFDRAGFFEPMPFTVEDGAAQTLTLTPAPLGEIVVEYAPSDAYAREPDRASVSPLDGQPMANGFMRPGQPKRFLPGRYRVEGWSAAGDIAPREIEVRAHETATVTLSPNPPD